MTGLENFFRRCFCYSLMINAGIVVIQFVTVLSMGFEFQRPFDLPANEAVFRFYTSFGICLCLVVMVRNRWNKFEHFLVPFGSIICFEGIITLSEWLVGVPVSVFELLGAVISLTVNLIFIAVTFLSLVLNIRHLLTPPVDQELAGGRQRKPGAAVSGSIKHESLAPGQGILLKAISVGLIIDSVYLVWQSSFRMQALRLDTSLLRVVPPLAYEFFIPLIFHAIAVVLIHRGWRKTSFWLPYMLIFLINRAYSAPWVGTVPTSAFVLWADRALVALILVNTAWSFLNWLKLRSGLPKANV